MVLNYHFPRPGIRTSNLPALSPKVLKWEAHGQVSNYCSITDWSNWQEGSIVHFKPNCIHIQQGVRIPSTILNTLQMIPIIGLWRRYQLGHDATDQTDLNYNAQDDFSIKKLKKN